jgi:hypothetical protein
MPLIIGLPQALLVKETSKRLNLDTGVEINSTCSARALNKKRWTWECVVVKVPSWYEWQELYFQGIHIMVSSDGLVNANRENKKYRHRYYVPRN